MVAWKVVAMAGSRAESTDDMKAATMAGTKAAKKVAC